MDPRQFFANDQFAVQTGIELLEIGKGYARARLPVTPRLYNSVNIVQGGAIFTLADFTFAVASNSHGAVAVAINVSITFLKAVRDGELFAEARELSVNPKLGAYSVRITDQTGELVATFEGLAYRKKDPLPFTIS